MPCSLSWRAVGSVLSWFAVGKAHSVSKAGLWMATPMQAGSDTAGMNKPYDVATAVFDALEAGEDEVLVDEMTRKVHSALALPVIALYPALASR
ncbi:hypothetical protein [Umezawaea sp. NPDC059074]|uniref:hypothetical protein n=1 Tax=Umezawaea sp. NPDC059074 TaxID=3346716 RepID=UPI00368FCA88